MGFCPRVWLNVKVRVGFGEGVTKGLIALVGSQIACMEAAVQRRRRRFLFSFNCNRDNFSLSLSPTPFIYVIWVFL